MNSTPTRENETESAAPIVYVVDDDPQLLDSLGQLIEAKGFRVETHSSGNRFLQDLDIEENACIVLDLRLPGIDGVAIQEELRRRGIRTPIVFITGYDDVPGAVAALRGGAVDLLTKPFSPTRLLETISESIERRRMDLVDEARADEIRARLGRLSRREREVLTLVASGLSNRDVTTRLGIGQRTVELHRKSVMDKMEADSFAALLKMYFSAGDLSG